MNVANRVVGTVAGVALMLVTASASAAWSLNNEASHLNFVSIKKDTVAEVNSFREMSGSISDQGAVNLEIALASVDTAIAIRDERMRTMLFETGLFPKAQVSAKVDMASFTKLKAGQSHSEQIALTFALHGESKTFKANVTVVKLEGDRFMVTSTGPIIINAADFGLVKGIEALREIANLPAISAAVPVTLNLVFDKQK